MPRSTEGCVDGLASGQSDPALVPERELLGHTLCAPLFIHSITAINLTADNRQQNNRQQHTQNRACRRHCTLALHSNMPLLGSKTLYSNSKQGVVLQRHEKAVDAVRALSSS